jgi:tetratricopeptide (TPR) repeat protein
MGAVRIRASLQQNIALLRTLQGKPDEGVSFAKQSLETFEQQGDRRLSTFSRIYLAMALAARGDLEAAENEARRAVSESEALPPAHASALACLADVELARHSVESALGHASEAHRILESLGGIEESESLVRVVYAEALAAAGRTSDAREAVKKAIAAVDERARKITIERWRRSFMGVPENRRLFSLEKKLA